MPVGLAMSCRGKLNAESDHAGQFEASSFSNSQLAQATLAPPPP